MNYSYRQRERDKLNTYCTCLKPRINFTLALWGPVTATLAGRRALMHHSNRKNAHCPDTDVRSVPGGHEQPYLDTRRPLEGYLDI